VIINYATSPTEKERKPKKQADASKTYENEQVSEVTPQGSAPGSAMMNTQPQPENTRNGQGKMKSIDVQKPLINSWLAANNH
jgi:hypothetical protein